MRLETAFDVHHPTLDGVSALFLKHIREIDFSGKRVLDVGAGCGVFAIAAAQGSASEVWAIDSNATAVDLIKKNAFNNNVRLQVCQSDLFNAIDKDKCFDIILCYPPERDRVETERFIERTFEQVPRHLCPEGTLIFGGTNPETFRALKNECGRADLKQRAFFRYRGWLQDCLILQL